MRRCLFQTAKKWLYVPKNKTLTSCEWKGMSLFSSLSREMLTFSRLNIHGNLLMEVVYEGRV